MAKLPEPQLNSLGAYDDRVVSLQQEVEFLRRNRRVLAVLAALSPAQVAEMRTMAGLPVGTLPLRVRAILHEEFLASASETHREGGVPDDWQDAVLWLQQAQGGPRSGMQILYALLPGKEPFWGSKFPFSRVMRQ